MVPAAARRAADALLVFLAVSLPLSTTGMQAAVLGLAGLSLAAWARGWPIGRRTPLDGVLGVFFTTLALSTLASGRPWEATGWLKIWVVLAYFVVFWWLRDRAHTIRFVRVLLAAAAIAAAYGILQHFTGADWYRTLLGRRTMVRPRDVGSSGYAVVGFFRNYLTFAHVMIFPLAWAVAFALRGQLLGLVTAPLVIVAIVFSTARGAWLAALAALGTLAVLVRGRRIVGAAAGVAAAAALAFAFTPDLRADALSMFSTGGENRGRIGIYRANLDIVHERPVFGLGFGRYRTAAKPYYAAYPDADRRSHAHSNYLHIAAEAGLLGLAAFGLLFAMALRTGWGAISAARDPESWAAAAGAWAGLVGFLVGGVTQYSFGDNEVATTMWVALAVLMRGREH